MAPTSFHENYYYYYYYYFTFQTVTFINLKQEFHTKIMCCILLISNAPTLFFSFIYKIRKIIKDFRKKMHKTILWKK